MEPDSTYDMKSESSVFDIELTNEYEASLPRGRSRIFEVIIDDKHRKYMDVYNHPDDIFWGIGVENECYLQLGTPWSAETFRQLHRRRERYSVDYYRNFREDELQRVFDRLHELPTVRYPIYINSHTFQNTDSALEHHTLYDEVGTMNPKFTESIHDRLLKECPYYNKVYNKSVVFDGDSIEFITQNFYKTTVRACVEEWGQQKKRWIKEITPFFQRWRIHGASDGISFPDHNFGLVSFLSTYRRNVTPCNNGTIHINLTLPTNIHNGIIVDMRTFASDHLKAIEAIQIVEPLLVATYGTPDLFSVIFPEKDYAIGSLRVALSRYISLHTYSTDEPMNGKLLLMKRPTDHGFWYNQLHEHGRSPYVKNEEIGYDINFNKFKNHGIEIRFLDAFPESYMEGLLSFLILLCVHAITTRPIRTVRCRKPLYASINICCVQRGFSHVLSLKECNEIILEDLCFREKDQVEHAMTAYDLLCHINLVLYRKYHRSEIIRNMLGAYMAAPPTLVNYNWEAYQLLYEDIYSKPLLILRAEEHPLEARTVLAPQEVAQLMKDGRMTIWVERSSQRCFPDQAYEDAGALLVERGIWRSDKARMFPSRITMGLKGLPKDATSDDVQGIHTFFAHCYKQQAGYERILSQLQQSTFIDYETMVDPMGKRVLSFCPASGRIGCYMALMAYYKTYTDVVGFPEYDENRYTLLLRELITLRRIPRVLLIGYGVAGQNCKQVLDTFGIPCTIWTRDTPKDRRVILDHDLLINAISLRPDAPREVFLEEDDLFEHDSSRTLSVICDISCDLGNPRNTLPIYKEYTTLDAPVRRIRHYPPLDLIAVPQLPALDPIHSSSVFSELWVNYVRDLPFYGIRRDISPYARAINESYQAFQTHVSRI